MWSETQDNEPDIAESGRRRNEELRQRRDTALQERRNREEELRQRSNRRLDAIRQERIRRNEELRQRRDTALQERRRREEEYRRRANERTSDDYYWIAGTQDISVEVVEFKESADENSQKTAVKPKSRWESLEI